MDVWPEAKLSLSALSVKRIYHGLKVPVSFNFAVRMRDTVSHIMMRRDATIEALETLLYSYPRKLPDPWSEVYYGHQELAIMESERVEMGVDMLGWNLFLGEVPQALWETAVWHRTKRGHTSWLKIPGSKLKLALYRFPSAGSPFFDEKNLEAPITPRDFTLRIRFNPTTLVQGHNMWSDLHTPFLRGIVSAQDELQRLGLAVDLLSAPLSELHLTRDVMFYGHQGPPEGAKQRQWNGVNQALRLMEWGKAPYARRIENYANSQSGQVAENRNIGLYRGSKSNLWAVYDKQQQYKDKHKGKPSPPNTMGRTLRIEWRIKKNSNVKEHLGIENVWGLTASFCRESEDLARSVGKFVLKAEGVFASWPECERLKQMAQEGSETKPTQGAKPIYQTFDEKFCATFFVIEESFGQQGMGRIDLRFLEKISPYFTSELQKQCLANLQKGNFITRDEVNTLLIVLNGIGAAKTRLLLRDAFELDSPSINPTDAKRRRKKHDTCLKTLARLRVSGHYNAKATWADLQLRVLGKWGVDLDTPAQLLISAPDPFTEEENDVSVPLFQRAAKPLLEKLAAYPHSDDDERWDHLCCGRWHLIADDLPDIYRQMCEVETELGLRQRITTLSKAQCLAMNRAEELHLLKWFPQSKKHRRYAKIVTLT